VAYFAAIKLFFFLVSFVLKAFFHHKEHKVEDTENTKISKFGLLVVGRFEFEFLSPASAKTSVPSAWNSVQIFFHAEDAGDVTRSSPRNPFD